MSATKNFVFDIVDEIRRGDLSFAEIARRYECDLETVQEVFDYMIDMENDDLWPHDELERDHDEAYEPDYDDSMDGDFDSAMASAGFGTDEDYGYSGEEF